MATGRTFWGRRPKRKWHRSLSDDSREGGRDGRDRRKWSSILRFFKSYIKLLSARSRLWFWPFDWTTAKSTRFSRWALKLYPRCTGSRCNNSNRWGKSKRLTHSILSPFSYRPFREDKIEKVLTVPYEETSPEDASVIPRSQRQLPVPKELWWILSNIYERTCDCDASIPEKSEESAADSQTPRLSSGGLENDNFRLTEFLNISGQGNASLTNKLKAQIKTVLMCIERGAKIPTESIPVIALLLVRRLVKNEKFNSDQYILFVFFYRLLKNWPWSYRFLSCHGSAWLTSAMTRPICYAVLFSSASQCGL